MENMQDQALTQDQAIQPDTAIEPKADAITEAVKPELVDHATDSFKKEISGLNRKITEQAAALDEIKKSSMADAERYQYELEQRENAIAAKEQALVKSSNRDKAVKFATENSIPLDLLDTLSYDNAEVVDNNLAKMKAVVDSERTKIIEEFKKASGYSPAAGGNVAGGVVTAEMIKTMTPSEVDLALKEGRVQGFGKL